MREANISTISRVFEDEDDENLSVNSSILLKSVFMSPNHRSMSSPLRTRNNQIRIKDKLGFNYISILKEYTDQYRMEFEFQFSQPSNFMCLCFLNKQLVGQGQGANKKEAKTEAAKQTIMTLIHCNKNAQYFAKFLDFEKKEPEEEGNVMLDLDDNSEKDKEPEAIIYLNQFCQKTYGQNLVFEFENVKNGFLARLKCGIHNEIGEGASKKIAKQNAAKLLCEKLNLGSKEKMQPIDKVAIKCQKILGQTPTYSEYKILESGKFSINIICGNFNFQGEGFKKKDAKNNAAQKLLEIIEKNNYLDLKNGRRIDYYQEDRYDSDEETKNKMDEISTSTSISKINMNARAENSSSTSFNKKDLSVLSDITNQKKKYVDLFQNYANTKIVQIIPSLKKQENQKRTKLDEYDLEHLKPKDKELKILETLLDEIFPQLNSLLVPLGIETYLLVGSYLTESIRRYKYDIDLLALYELKNNNNDDVLLTKIKYELQKKCEANGLGEKYMINIVRGGANKTKNLEITLTDDIKTHNNKHTINIYPCNKGSIKLKKMMKVNMDCIDAMKKIKEGKDQKDLKILMRLLKYWKDNHFLEDLQGDIIDLILYITTKKFSEINFIQNIKSFFEFIAVGGLSCSRTSWLWEDFSEVYWEYVQTAVRKENVDKIEKYCKEVVQKGDLEFLIE